MMRIKKNDTVLVLSGKDKGKKGEVLAVFPKHDEVRVKGVALATKHVKARQQGAVSAIKHEEALIPACKVMPVCPACKKACRFGTKRLESGEAVRVCCSCKEVM